MSEWDPRDTDERPLFNVQGHGRPVTRRDFLARGFLTGAAAVTTPSLLSLLAMQRPALAAPGDTCGVGGGGSFGIPYIGFDLAGGASIAGSNVLVGRDNRQDNFLDVGGYAKLGLPETMLPSLPGQIASDMGLLFHTDSAFYRGMKLRLQTPGIEDDITGCIICARSNNDTDTNPHNPIYGISAGGSGGALVELIGTESSLSGGRSIPPMSMVDPSKRPTKVDSPRDARGLVDTGNLVGLLGKEDAGLVMLASELMTEVKLGKMTEEEATEELIRCGYIESRQLVTDFGEPDDLDPELDPLITTGANPIFDVADYSNSSFRKTASVMKLVVNRQAGAGTIELGGYDYHDGTRATGEARDLVAGQCMGACLEYAARIGTPLMLYIFSDGSLASNGQVEGGAGRDKGIWQGDNGGTASVFMMVYNPGQRVTMAPAGLNHQIGSFSGGGSVVTDDGNRLADNVDLLAEAIVLNYMALNGRKNEFSGLFGTGLGVGAEIDDYVAFEAIP